VHSKGAGALHFCRHELIIPEIIMKPTSRSGGERDAAAWWDEHRELLADAWKEYGEKHHSVYEFDWAYIDPGLCRALQRGDSDAMVAQLHEVAPGRCGIAGMA